NLQGSVFTAAAIQFLMWLPFCLVVLKSEMSPFGTAGILFCGLILTGFLYTTFLESFLIRFFQGRNKHTKDEVFTSVAEITDEGISYTDRGRRINYQWDAFHAVYDTEKNIIFIGDTLHAVIPAKCFNHFLEKDAFVRECQKRMPAYLSDGPDAFD
ncbi:YcxB family protein, partial [Hellea sp.]|nr:YcxB family protein [Hellea sp.]